MNSLTTLYFPGTAIRSLRRYPLFLVFQNVHLLAPVESDPAEGDAQSPDSFIKSGFCQVHTPCPLGDDRNRFLRLLSDIKNRKDDYAAQLSSLTLAAMTGTTTKTEDESERSIVRSLSQSGPMPPKIQELEKRADIWQARLVLAIGELLDQEEEEITLNLAVLEAEEKELFKELQGEDDQEEEPNPFVGLSRLEGPLHGNSAANFKQRYTAWRTFYLAGPVREYDIFLGSDRESSDMLLETYQQMTGYQAPLVLRLQLPTFVGRDSGEAYTAANDFAAKNSAFLDLIEQKLVELINQQAIAGQQLQPAAPQLSLAASWEKLLAADFPEERFGRISLSFYLFPGLSCRTVLEKTANPENRGKNGLLAVIN